MKKRGFKIEPGLGKSPETFGFLSRMNTYNSDPRNVEKQKPMVIRFTKNMTIEDGDEFEIIKNLTSPDFVIGNIFKKDT